MCIMLNESVSSNKTAATTAELLSQLSPDNLATVADLVAMLADQPPTTAAAPATEPTESESSKRVFDDMPEVERTEALMLLARYRTLTPEDQADFLSELNKEVDAVESEPEQVKNPLDIESVHTIARTVFAKMLTNEIGIKLFPRGLSDIHLDFDVVGGLYSDIAEAIVSGLAGCDMDELHMVACLGSAR